MEQHSRILIAVLLGAAVLVGALAGSLDLGTVYGANPPAVTTGPGITRNQAIDALFSEDMKNELDLRNVLVFVKAGGSASEGQKSHILRVDMPVRATASDDIIFQYFIDVSNDVTANRTAHCSDVRIHVYYGGVKVYTTAWMGYENRNPSLPLQTDKITIHDVPAGWRDIGLVPEGRGGGCNNSSYLYAWGGTVVIYN